jgi:hypothetical protein
VGKRAIIAIFTRIGVIWKSFAKSDLIFERMVHFLYPIMTSLALVTKRALFNGLAPISLRFKLHFRATLREICLMWPPSVFLRVEIKAGLLVVRNIYRRALNCLELLEIQVFYVYLLSCIQTFKFVRKNRAARE